MVHKVDKNPQLDSRDWSMYSSILYKNTGGKAIPFCGEHPGPRFEDKFRSANQMDGISKAVGDQGWTGMYTLVAPSLSAKFIENSHQNLPV